MLARQIRQLMSWHAATCAPLSHPLNIFCRRRAIAWSNAETDVDINGKRRLVQAIARRMLEKGAVFLDAGDRSRLVVDSAPDARLLAFEPVPPVREKLAANLAGADAEILPYAMSNETGSVVINYTRGNRAFLRDFFAALTPRCESRDCCVTEASISTMRQHWTMSFRRTSSPFAPTLKANLPSLRNDRRMALMETRP